MKRKLYRRPLYFLFRGLAFILSLLSISVGYRIADGLGVAAFGLLGRERRKTLTHLEIAFGKEKSQKEIRKIGRGVFQNLARNLIELIHFPKIHASNIDQFVTLRGREKLDAVLKKGKGAVLLISHLGNWELLVATLHLKGYGGKIAARRLRDENFDRLINRLRREKGMECEKGMEVVYRGESPRKLLQSLRENQFLGILADQDVESVSGVFVDFFGKPAYTPIAPVQFAMAAHCPIIPCFIIRENGHHTLTVEDPIEMVKTGDKQKDLVDNTRRWSALTESYIRRYPDQWVWMHRRWKTQEATSNKEQATGGTTNNQIPNTK